MDDAGGKILEWCAGVADAGMRIRFDNCGGSIALRVIIQAKDKKVLRAWAGAMGIPVKIRNVGLFVPAKDQDRVLGILRDLCVRDDIDSTMGFREIRGWTKRQQIKAVKKEIREAGKAGGKDA